MKKLLFLAAFLIISLIFFVLSPTKSIASGPLPVTVTPLNNPDGNTTRIDENTPAVSVKFTGLTPGSTYRICFDTSRCNEGAQFSWGGFTAATDSTVTVPVLCGNGDQLKKDCGNTDFFHTQTYNLAIITDDSQETVISRVDFPVQLFFPIISLTSNNSFKPGGTITVGILGSRYPISRQQRNNYLVNWKGTNGSSDPSISSNDIQVDQITHLGKRDFNGIVQGNYRVTVVGDDLELGNTFATFDVIVDINGGSSSGGSGSSGGGTGPEGTNPCASGQCCTAIGCVSTSFKEFTAKILSIAIGIAGGLALVLMVRGSISILMSQGDPQKVNAGREVIIAAVAGLLFLIFSVLILRFIGLKIFSGIPGIS